MGYNNRWDLIIPMSIRNRFKNPSVEQNLLNITAVGATLVRTTATQKRGAWSIQATPTASLNDGLYQSLPMPAANAGVFSVDVLGTNGVNYKIYGWDATAGTFLQNGLGGNAIAQFTATGAWQRVQVYCLNGVNTDCRFYVTKDNNNSTGVFYVDGFMFVDTPVLTDTYMYFDGDSPGSVWEAFPHQSSSYLSEDADAGGLVINLETISTDSQGESDILVMSQSGTGHPPVQNIATPYGASHGSKYQRTVVIERPFTLKAWIQGSHWDDLLSTRRALIERLQPGQPMQIRYRGRDLTLLLNAVYESGLEFQGTQGFMEQPGIRFTAYDPFWREEGNKGATLTPFTTASGTYVMRRDPDGTWNVMGNALNGSVLCTAIAPNGVVWIGGQFTTAGGTSVNRFAYYDEPSNTWKRGTTSGTVGANGDVNKIVFRPDGVMFVGGAFSTFNGVANTAGVAKFDPSTGTTTSINTGGFGASSQVTDMVYGVYNGIGTLWIGGVSATYKLLGIYQGTSISIWGGGVTTGTRVAALELIGTTLYAGGQFTQVNDGANVNTENFASWDLSTSNGFGQAPATGYIPGARVGGLASAANIMALMADASGDLIVAGGFDSMLGQDVSNICRFNGSSAYPLGQAVGNLNYYGALALAPDGTIWMGTDANSVDGFFYPNQIHQWIGQIWWPSESTMNINPMSLSFRNDGTLYMGLDDNISSLFSARTTVSNPGSAPAGFTLVVKGPGTLWRITNGRNGSSLAFVNSFALDSEYITIECGQHSTRITSSFRGDVTGMMLPGSRLSELVLEPGFNPISVLFDDQSATGKVVAFWSNTFWSIDGTTT